MGIPSEGEVDHDDELEGVDLERKVKEAVKGYSGEGKGKGALVDGVKGA